MAITEQRDMPVLNGLAVTMPATHASGTSSQALGVTGDRAARGEEVASPS